MIPVAKNFSPVRVTTKPPTVDSAPGESGPASTHEARNLSLSEATDLLDWLENHQIRSPDVEMDPAGRVTVRWIG